MLHFGHNFYLQMILQYNIKSIKMPSCIDITTSLHLPVYFRGQRKYKKVRITFGNWVDLYKLENH